jgi:hypothetical protein
MYLDYQTTPDLGSHDVTVDCVRLFQRYPQKADAEWLDQQFEAEVIRHLRICELAILRAAAGKYYWCDLPRHAVTGVVVEVERRLECSGFILERSCEAYEKSVPDKYDKTKSLKAVCVEDRCTANWFKAQALEPKKLAKEIRRRRQIEESARRLHTPRPLSHIDGETISAGGAIWAAVLDNTYVVEVQNIHNQHTLCLFTREGELLHSEPTNVAFNALFGPDESDVNHWGYRAAQIVDDMKSRVPNTQPRHSASATQEGN